MPVTYKKSHDDCAQHGCSGGDCDKHHPGVTHAEHHPGMSHDEWHATQMSKSSNDLLRSLESLGSHLSKATEPYVGPKRGLWADPGHQVPYEPELSPRQVGNRVRDSHGHDRGEATRLHLYADNDPHVYGAKERTHKQLINRMAAGDYQHHRAVRAFEHVANYASQKAAKDGGGVGHAYSPAVRRAVARALADQFHAEASSGNYDSLKFKKFQQNPERDQSAKYFRTEAPQMSMFGKGLSHLENLARSLGKGDVSRTPHKRELLPDQPQPSERVPSRIGAPISAESMGVHKPAKVSGEAVKKNIDKVKAYLAEGMPPAAAVRAAYPDYSTAQIKDFMDQYGLADMHKSSYGSAMDKLIGKHSQIDTRSGGEKFLAQNGVPSQVQKSISDADVDARIAEARRAHRMGGFRWHESEHLK